MTRTGAPPCWLVILAFVACLTGSHATETPGNVEEGFLPGLENIGTLTKPSKDLPAGAAEEIPGPEKMEDNTGAPLVPTVGGNGSHSTTKNSAIPAPNSRLHERPLSRRSSQLKRGGRNRSSGASAGGRRVLRVRGGDMIALEGPENIYGSLGIFVRDSNKASSPVFLLTAHSSVGFMSRGTVLKEGTGDVVTSNAWFFNDGLGGDVTLLPLEKEFDRKIDCSIPKIGNVYDPTSDFHCGGELKCWYYGARSGLQEVTSLVEVGRNVLEFELPGSVDTQGDSGSIIVNQRHEAVAMVFSGTESSTPHVNTTSSQKIWAYEMHAVLASFRGMAVEFCAYSEVFNPCNCLVPIDDAVIQHAVSGKNECRIIVGMFGQDQSVLLDPQLSIGSVRAKFEELDLDLDGKLCELWPRDPVLPILDISPGSATLGNEISQTDLCGNSYELKCVSQEGVILSGDVPETAADDGKRSGTEFRSGHPHQINQKLVIAARRKVVDRLHQQPMANRKPMKP